MEQSYILLTVAPIVCGDSVFGPCFVMQCLVSFIVAQPSSLGSESWLPYFNSHPSVL